MERRSYLVGLGTASIAALAGCSTLGSLTSPDDDEPCGEGCDIGMSRNEFLPDRYEVSVGDTVVWKNTSGAVHTITAYDDAVPDGAEYFATGGYANEEEAREAWKDGEGAIDTRETYSHTFEVPGTYGYVCIPHEAGGMTGTIVVDE